MIPMPSQKFRSLFLRIFSRTLSCLALITFSGLGHTHMRAPRRDKALDSSKSFVHVQVVDRDTGDVDSFSHCPVDASAFYRRTYQGCWRTSASCSNTPLKSHRITRPAAATTSFLRPS